MRCPDFRRGRKDCRHWGHFHAPWAIVLRTGRLAAYGRWAVDMDVLRSSNTETKVPKVRENVTALVHVEMYRPCREMCR